MSSTETLALKIQLGQEAHTIARQFAVEQTTPQKGKQIYLNTLAVYAVYNYLKWLQIDTALEKGDSWHPLKRALFDIADLVIPNIGKLECRPVQPGETAIYLPPEVIQNRIGYVAVQFSERLQEVQLLGFIRTVTISDACEQIPLTSLKPLNLLFDCIPEAVVQPASASQTRVNLSQWFENLFENSWMALEEIFASIDEKKFALRSVSSLSKVSVARARVIDLGLRVGNEPLALIVAIAPLPEQKVEVLVQLHPMGEKTYLPSNLKLYLQTESGEILQEVVSRSNDNFIQLKRFRGNSGESFNIQVFNGNLTIKETFVI
ncbi:DUF1822 family protein [Nostocaceae cyanobacterium CENA369]|uniref:DUF1822 family protein n=1 Tax=Dendronalium phyllosphericum CENA369 TaxID=1725256 RepID=A0A8J7LGA5_9NOST|nr:DUF1822 family protein [Dendronalium phyllosphericum]MBH8574933.1 DUF1822 family protein [Dendronalium phyllosphericum CENA369]